MSRPPSRGSVGYAASLRSDVSTASRLSQALAPPSHHRRSSSRGGGAKQQSTGTWINGLPPPQSLPPIPQTQQRAPRGSASSTSSVFSHTTLMTESSLRAPSSIAVSGVSEVNSRLAAVEKELAAEKDTRQQLLDELSQLKQLFLTGQHARATPVPTGPSQPPRLTTAYPQMIDGRKPRAF